MADEPVLTLEEVVVSKKRELKMQAEDAWWGAFTTDDQLPIMNAFKILLIRATNRRTLRAAEQQALDDGIAVSQKLETKIAAVNAATTIQAVQGISWNN